MTHTNANANTTNDGDDGGGGCCNVVAITKKSLVRVGKYQILGPLGKGNFARVEEAIHTVLGVKVSVIKLESPGARRALYNLDNAAANARNSYPPGPTDCSRLSKSVECSAYAL